jgi:hypothetical protein
MYAVPRTILYPQLVTQSTAGPGMRELVECGYIERKSPLVLIRECGTGKTHLAIDLCPVKVWTP